MMRTLSNLFFLLLLIDLSFSSNCNFEPLPTDFNSLSYLGFNKEFQIQGEYSVNFTNFAHFIDLTIEVESSVRVYVAPHIVDIDLWMFKGDEFYGSSSLAVGTEEVYFKTLQPDSYTLQVYFYGAWSYHEECPSLTMEASVVPRDKILERAGNFGDCTTESVYPDIPSLNSITKEGFTYQSSAYATNYAVVSSTEATSKYNFLKEYQFTLPKSSESTFWKFEAALGRYFLSGGSLGLVLINRNVLTTTPTDLSCYSTSDSNCTIGEISQMNLNIIKDVLVAGDYSLWIYDNIGEKDSSLAPDCIPISLSLSVSSIVDDESFLNCQGSKIPSTLNGPGLLDTETKFLYYNRDLLLDLTKAEHSITFTVTEPSFFRVLIAQHRVDIDLKLVDTTDTADIAYAYSAGGEEGLIAELKKDIAYNLTIIYYGTYDIRFCETFSIELAISTFAEVQAPTFNFCDTTKQILPDLSFLPNSLIANNGTAVFQNSQVYSTIIKPISTRVLLQQKFTISQVSKFHLNVESSFLLGNIEAVLYYKVNGTFSDKIEGHNYQNLYNINEELQKGEYQLEIVVGQIQPVVADVDNFPDCALYSLDLKIEPLYEYEICWQNLRIPTSLNTPQFLGTSNNIHFQNEYLVPLGLRTVSKESITFLVEEPSLFRAYTEPHAVDIDFRLYDQENNRVALAISINEEEEIVYKLDANQNYTFEIVYYNWEGVSHTQDKCRSFNLEMAIVPDKTDFSTNCEGKLPPQDLFPVWTNEIFYAKDTFYFLHSDQPQNVSIPFSVEAGKGITFKASIEYDFIWTDLALKIVDQDGTTVTTGQNHVNLNTIHSLLLSGGNYHLLIYQPAALEFSDYELCIGFTLEVGGVEDSKLPSWSDTRTVEDYTCIDTYLPISWNDPAYISEFSGKQMHIKQNILTNVQTATDYVDFTLTETSFFRIVIPAHPTIDVDIYLYKGKHPSGTYMASRTGYSEEALLANLGPGDYFIKLFYYAYDFGSLPNPDECVFVPTEISISPLSYLESIPSITTSCIDEVSPPESLTDSYFNRDFTVSWEVVTGFKYQKQMKFTVTEGAKLFFELRYPFPLWSVDLTLDGQVGPEGSEPIPKSFSSILGINYQYIDEYLQPGEYTITLNDPNELLAGLPIKCSPFNINYNLTGLADLPDTYCDETHVLPTNLYSENGGSVPYGGPQKEDGTVKIYGDKFYMSGDSNSAYNYISFNVTKPSLLRVFNSAGEGNDIDFHLYKKATDWWPLYSAQGTDSVESAIWKLEPQDEAYVLNVLFYSVSSEENCNYFQFEFALKPNETVYEELLCPVPLPNYNEQHPDEIVDLPPGQYTYVVSDGYLFTQNQIDSNTDEDGYFRYRMTLNAYSNATFLAWIGFDFLANDFRLTLTDKTTDEIIDEGVSSGSPTADSYVNFENIMFSDVPAGVYYLDINERVEEKNFDTQFGEYCHKFAFFLSAFTFQLGDVPTILSIIPPIGQELNPNNPLLISITFSKPVLNVWDTDALTYINDNQIVTLLPVDSNGISNGAGAINPKYVLFDETYRDLDLTFGADYLTNGGNYLLQFDSTKFTDTDHVPFILTNSSRHLYSMLSCECSGKGTCVKDISTNEFKCDCDSPWAGNQCQSCRSGFHIAGDTCIANQECQENSCNQNGYCSDYTGSIRCTCKTGFATLGEDYCSICAPGFEDYPNCTKIEDPLTRNTLCLSPVIPVTLNTISYLGKDEEVHLQGDFFLDASTGQHKTLFDITEDSYFRVYVEPHWIDIDVWLFVADSAGEIEEVIEYAVSYNKEESIYRLLSGGKSYGILFRYYLWGDDRSAICETFNLELGIVSKTIMTQEQSTIACTESTTGPFPNDGTAEEFKVFTNDVSFPSGTIYQVVPALEEEDKSGNYFWSFDFEIAPEDEFKVAKLITQIDYRFLPGDITLLLEEGSKRTHCTSTIWDSDHEYCSTGWNLINQNRLEKILRPGKYTLWLYEPSKQDSTISKCSQYQFSFELKFEDAELDLFSCPQVALLPSSLNVPGYLDPSGYLHIRNEFMPENNNIAFTLASKSAFRVHGSAEDFSFNFHLTNKDGTPVIHFLTDEAQIFQVLEAGDYILSLDSFIGDSFCPKITMEIEIEPITEEITVVCPIGPNVLPQIPQPLGDDFFFQEENFSSTRTGNWEEDKIVAEFVISTEDTAIVEAGVASSFLKSDLRLKLTLQEPDEESPNIISGEHRFNYNHIYSVLEPGSYVISIERPKTSTTGLPSCDIFDFDITISPYTETKDECYSAAIKPPSNFNSVRFLGSDGKMNWQDQLRIPSDLFSVSMIFFNVTEPTVIRAFTEPAAVDVDIAIKDLTHDTFLGYSNSIYDEEATGRFAAENLLVVAQPDTWYSFDFSYFTIWPETDSSCSSFNFEIAMAPVSSLVKDKTCQDHLPPQIKSIPYMYNSQQPVESLHFASNLESPRKFEYIFSITEPASFYSQLSYDFLTSDIVLVLRANEYEKKTAPIWGVNRLDGNYLFIDSLPVGSYTLTIEESILSIPETVGCVNFDFILLIVPRQDTKESDWVPVFPETLSSVSFLPYNGQAYLSNVYDVFLSSQQIPVTGTQFKVNSDSRIRMRIDEEGVTYRITDVSSGAVVLEAINGQLTAGLSPDIVYSIVIDWDNSGYKTLRIQLEIDTIDGLKNLISKYDGSLCTSTVLPTITPDSDGFYQTQMPQIYIDYNTMKNHLLPSMFQFIDFKLDRESVVDIQVGFEFLLDGFLLKIVGQEKNTLENIEISAVSYYNLQEIYQLLPAGSYTIQFYTSYSLALPDTADYHWCTTYSLSIIIKDSVEKGDHVDCSTYKLLPSDLMTTKGGSKNFGGPMVEGFIHLYEEQFYISKTRPHEEISFTLDEPSVISILAWGTSSYNIEISISDVSGGSSVQLEQESRNYRETTASFITSSSEKNKAYNLVFDFPSVSDSSTGCPYFGLQISIKTVAQIRNEFKCSYDETLEFPSNRIELDKDGFGTQYIYSHIPSTVFSGGEFSFAIDFEIAAPSRVYSSLSYNSYLVATDMTIIEHFEGYEADWFQTRYSGKENFGGLTTLSVGTYEYFYTGNYTFNISQTMLHIPVNGANVLCIPYIWEVKIFPIDTVPYVSEISPSQSIDADPNVDLKLELEFSEDIYVKPDTELVRLESKDYQYVIDSFYLSTATKGSVDPSRAYLVGSKWHLIFPKESIDDKTSYQLSLKSPVPLVDSAGDTLRLPTKNIYQMIDIACSGHGHFNDFGVCACAPGYASIECNACAEGYKNVGSDASVKCLKEASVECTNSTCGCDPNYPGECRALGSCSLKESGTYCTCWEQYTSSGAPGDNCEACANGYIGTFPACVAAIACDEECKNGGTCDQTQGICSCPINFKPDDCSSCASGYSGESCTADVTASNDGGLNAIEILGIIVAILVVVAIVGYLVHKRITGGGYNVLPAFNFNEQRPEDEDDELELLG